MNDSHILLTSLGVLNPPLKDYPYEMAGKIFSAKLSPIALFNLLPEDKRFGKVIALCTEDALRDTYPILSDGLKDICHPVDISEGKNDEELSGIIHKILNNIPKGSELTLDLTHGLRPIPFLFFTSCLYLQALKGVRIRNAWYGKLEKNKPSPFVDLSTLLNMVEWFQAVHSFKDMKNPGALVDKMKGIPMDQLESKNLSRSFSDFVDTINEFTINWGAGLPLELGSSSISLRGKYSNIKEKYDVSSIPIPLADDLFKEIASSAQPFCFFNQKSHGNWKRELPLTLEEINREWELIDTYFESGFYNNALGLLREFVVTRSMLSLKSKDEWLNKKSRLHFEGKLGALTSYWKEHKDAIPEGQRALASLWDELTQGRNDLHHHGMNPNNVNVINRAKKLRSKWDLMKSHMNDDDFWKVDFGGGSGCMLISPLGLSPGLLYSALCQVRPEILLAIVSAKSLNCLHEAINRSVCKPEVIYRILKDPYLGFEEIPDIVTASREKLLAADEVICNATGGTTAMQYAIMRLSERASSLGRPVKWVAMIDNRPAEDQRKDPYVVGEKKNLEIY